MKDLRLSRLPSLWLDGAVAISLFFVVATVLCEELQAESYLLQKFTLSGENNLGAWWSGMLLALASLHAYDGQVLWRRRRADLARAWALIALVLLILSADEVSSIHERLGLLGEHLGIGPWPPLIPFALVLLAMLGYAVFVLWSAEAQRVTVWLILLGFVLLGSTALQEFIEHRFVWQTAGARAIRAALEEGAELAGMLVLLKATMTNTAFCRQGKSSPCIEALRELRLPATAAALALAPILALVTAHLPDNNGHPADWPAALLFLAAGLVACMPLFKGERISRFSWNLGLACCGASAVVVAIGPAKVFQLGSLAINVRLLALSIIGFGVAAMWARRIPGRGATPFVGSAVVAAGALAVIATLPIGNAFIYLLSQLLALAIYVVSAKMEQPEWSDQDGEQAVPFRAHSLE